MSIDKKSEYLCGVCKSSFSKGERSWIRLGSGRDISESRTDLNSIFAQTESLFQYLFDWLLMDQHVCVDDVCFFQITESAVRQPQKVHAKVR